MDILDTTIFNQDKRQIEDCYQSLAHSVIRQAIDDQKIDVNYYTKKLLSYRAKMGEKVNKKVLENYKLELKEAIEDKDSADDFMNNGIDLENWISIAFELQLEAGNKKKDIKAFADMIRKKAKTQMTVRGI